jgi:hypothetical protein
MRVSDGPVPRADLTATPLRFHPFHTQLCGSSVRLASVQSALLRN